MGLGKTFILCSPFVGRLVRNGDQPVGGVRLERTWTWGWNSKSGRDEVVTGSDGRFEFGQVKGSSLFASFAPHEPAVLQVITAYDGDREVELWRLDKRNYDLNGELEGRHLNMTCHLDREPAACGRFWGTSEESQPLREQR